MTRWSYMVTDARTSTVLARDIPMSGVSFSDSLKGGGTFTGSYPANWKFAGSIHEGTRSYLLIYRLVWPMRDGQPMGCYMITGYPSTDFESPLQQVQGSRVDFILDHRLIRQTLNFIDVDQCDIFRDLVNYGLGRNTVHSTPIVPPDHTANQIPWIRLDSKLSGVIRTRQETTGNTDDGYPAAARKVVGTCLKQLTELSDTAARTSGPEYRLEYAMDNADPTSTTYGLPYVKIVQGYPAVGYSRDDLAKPVFEYPGGNIISLKYGVDGTTLVNRADVTGQEKEGVKPIGTATLQYVIDDGFPLWEGTWSESSVQDVAVLNQKADGQLDTGTESWSITLDGNRKPGFGSYGLGDYAWLRVKRQGVRIPDVTVRITGWSVSVDDSGVAETVTPTVEQVWLPNV